MNSSFRYDPQQRLYRNRETGVILGVCAGLAEYFNVEVWVVRVIAVISLYFFTIVTGAVYLGLGLMLRDRPLMYRSDYSENDFWRNSGGTG